MLLGALAASGVALGFSLTMKRSLWAMDHSVDSVETRIKVLETKWESKLREEFLDMKREIREDLYHYMKMVTIDVKKDLDDMKKDLEDVN